MNPSALGWINKLLTILPECQFLHKENADFYNALKHTGFIYGSNISTLCDTLHSKEFNEEERCKINLISAFYYMHHSEKCGLDFIQTVIGFYKAIDEHKRSFLSELFGDSTSDKTLEQIVHKRIHIDDNIITKNFNYFLINVFLFIDVLGYRHFLQKKTDTKAYVSSFEATIETIVFSVLNSKQQKTKYDISLTKLFEASLGHKSKQSTYHPELLHSLSNALEKLYIIDAVCMASWGDKEIDNAEYVFINQLQRDLGVASNILTQAIEDINTFYSQHKDAIAFLNSKNLAQSFYDNSSSFVTRLIKRNSKRLLKELSQSKEAVTLLATSTKRNLTPEEQKKIQNQLLDIFKSIPSLAIFMLPGGMVLLPLFIKFIPKLLPSAFDDNRIENNEEI